MMKELQQLESDALSELSTATSEEQVLTVKTKYLGRKGLLTGLLRNISRVPDEEKPLFGKRCNELKNSLNARFDQAIEQYTSRNKEQALFKEKIDVTLPGRSVNCGRVHPVVQIRREICSVFSSFGFSIVEGPEIELDYYNFEALNIPKDHPARDMQDTFYIDENIVLRTHTSPVQIRVMEKIKPPLRILSPGKVYRRDSDVSHTPMFHQIEGLLVDKNVTFGDLKGILSAFLKKIFGSSTMLRFRPSFFPFTEPSAEVDICCVMCGGKGCRVCGQSGWLE
ncbi:MAG: phenylalanine--tRNA ligase subunit alpha, partial [Deltaproteobacteria bacterium]|nr:phenylalanine--tRNA ligase subunit alpha [Deltaproteobacteria bacterium]